MENMTNKDERCRESVHNLETRVAQLEMLVEQLLHDKAIVIDDSPSTHKCVGTNGCAAWDCDKL
jgi:archaellum component FlaC